MADGFTWPRATPSFFKVLIGDFSTHLRIPPAFVKHFDGEVPDKSKIRRSPDGKVWRVRVQKMEEGFFFRKGWKGFVKDNVLESGDFLVFHYFGNSKFEVTIYGKHCCEKKLLAAPPANHYGGPHLQGHDIQEKAKRDRVSCGFNSSRKGIKTIDKRGSEEADYECKNIDRRSKVVIHIKSDSSSSDRDRDRDHDYSSDGMCNKVVVDEKINARVVSATRLGRLDSKVRDGLLKATTKFVSTHPFFKVVMQSTYLRASFMRIPKEFYTSHVRKGRPRTVKLQASGKFWAVKLMINQKWSWLGEGWELFVNDNALQVGDVCVFEMLQSKETVFKVSFFRCLIV